MVDVYECVMLEILEYLTGLRYRVDNNDDGDDDDDDDVRIDAWDDIASVTRSPSPERDVDDALESLDVVKVMTFSQLFSFDDADDDDAMTSSRRLLSWNDEHDVKSCQNISLDTQNDIIELNRRFSLDKQSDVMSNQRCSLYTNNDVIKSNRRFSLDIRTDVITSTRQCLLLNKQNDVNMSNRVLSLDTKDEVTRFGHRFSLNCYNTVMPSSPLDSLDIRNDVTTLTRQFSLDARNDVMTLNRRFSFDGDNSVGRMKVRLRFSPGDKNVNLTPTSQRNGEEKRSEFTTSCSDLHQKQQQRQLGPQQGQQQHQRDQRQKQQQQQQQHRNEEEKLEQLNRLVNSVDKFLFLFGSLRSTNFGDIQFLNSDGGNFKPSSNNIRQPTRRCYSTVNITRNFPPQPGDNEIKYTIIRIEAKSQQLRAAAGLEEDGVLTAAAVKSVEIPAAAGVRDGVISVGAESAGAGAAGADADTRIGGDPGADRKLGRIESFCMARGFRYNFRAINSSQPESDVTRDVGVNDDVDVDDDDAFGIRPGRSFAEGSNETRCNNKSKSVKNKSRDNSNKNSNSSSRNGNRKVGLNKRYSSSTRDININSNNSTNYNIDNISNNSSNYKHNNNSNSSSNNNNISNSRLTGFGEKGEFSVSLMMTSMTEDDNLLKRQQRRWTTSCSISRDMLDDTSNDMSYDISHDMSPDRASDNSREMSRNVSYDSSPQTSSPSELKKREECGHQKLFRRHKQYENRQTADAVIFDSRLLPTSSVSCPQLITPTSADDKIHDACHQNVMVSWPRRERPALSMTSISCRHTCEIPRNSLLQYHNDVTCHAQRLRDVMMTPASHPHQLPVFVDDISYDTSTEMASFSSYSSSSQFSSCLNSCSITSTANVDHCDLDRCDIDRCDIDRFNFDRYHLYHCDQDRYNFEPHSVDLYDQRDIAFDVFKRNLDNPGLDLCRCDEHRCDLEILFERALDDLKRDATETDQGESELGGRENRGKREEAREEIEEITWNSNTRKGEGEEKKMGENTNCRDQKPSPKNSSHKSFTSSSHPSSSSSSSISSSLFSTTSWQLEPIDGRVTCIKLLDADEKDDDENQISEDEKSVDIGLVSQFNQTDFDGSYNGDTEKNIKHDNQYNRCCNNKCTDSIRNCNNKNNICCINNSSFKNTNANRGINNDGSKYSNKYLNNDRCNSALRRHKALLVYNGDVKSLSPFRYCSGSSVNLFDCDHNVHRTEQEQEREQEQGREQEEEQEHDKELDQDGDRQQELLYFDNYWRLCPRTSSCEATIDDSDDDTEDCQKGDIVGSGREGRKEVAREEGLGGGEEVVREGEERKEGVRDGRFSEAMNVSNSSTCSISQCDSNLSGNFGRSFSLQWEIRDDAKDASDNEDDDDDDWSVNAHCDDAWFCDDFLPSDNLDLNMTDDIVCDFWRNNVTNDIDVTSSLADKTITENDSTLKQGFVSSQLERDVTAVNLMKSSLIDNDTDDHSTTSSLDSLDVTCDVFRVRRSEAAQSISSYPPLIDVKAYEICSRTSPTFLVTAEHAYTSAAQRARREEMLRQSVDRTDQLTSIPISKSLMGDKVNYRATYKEGENEMSEMTNGLHIADSLSIENGEGLRINGVLENNSLIPHKKREWLGMNDTLKADLQRFENGQEFMINGLLETDWLLYKNGADVMTISQERRASNALNVYSYDEDADVISDTFTMSSVSNTDDDVIENDGWCNEDEDYNTARFA